MQATSVPSRTRVDEIVALDQPVLRNLLITQGYHDLSDAMTALLGTGDGTWCMFGTWASKTAGAFIRGDELPAAARGMVRASPVVQEQASRVERALQEGCHVAVAPLDLAEEVAGRLAGDVSLYIGQGNKVVFEEMGGAYAQFIAVATSGDLSDESMDRLLGQFEPGAAQPDAVTVDWTARTVRSDRRGGQSLLREMLRHYYLAMSETDGHKKAQLVLYANALGGIHEQTRLQPYVEKALDAPVADLFREMLHARATAGETDPHRRHAVHCAVDCLAHPAARSVEILWQSCATVALMTMPLPDGTLRLGEDLPAPPGAPLFPAALAAIDLPALADLLAQYGALTPRPRAGGNRTLRSVEQDLDRLRHRPTAAGSGAADWASLSQRMRFILELFRSRQQDAVLRSQPFSEDQRRALAEEVVPAGKL
ncbi:MAG: hypothetical protein ACRD1D_04605 [Acidimicrobiales bacterium]